MKPAPGELHKSPWSIERGRDRKDRIPTRLTRDAAAATLAAAEERRFSRLHLVARRRRANTAPLPLPKKRKVREAFAASEIIAAAMSAKAFRALAETER